MKREVRNELKRLEKCLDNSKSTRYSKEDIEDVKRRLNKMYEERQPLKQYEVTITYQTVVWAYDKDEAYAQAVDKLNKEKVKRPINKNVVEKMPKF